MDESKSELEMIAKKDPDDKVRQVASLKLAGRSIPSELLKSPEQLDYEEKERMRTVSILAKNEGIDVCMNCLTIKPSRCSSCNACIKCVGGYSSTCYSCGDD